VGIAQGMIEETAEERIERLRSELAEAEAAAKAKAEVATEEAPAEEGITVDIPTGALVIVEGAEGGGGSGFIAKLRDRLFFVTNIHVLAGARGAEIRTADGQSLALPDYAFLSQKRDIAILPVVWTGEFLKVSASLSFDDVKIGDAITVMGNSDGVGVATRLHGDIDGIGPDQIEISAKFVPGNSGSPIIHNERATVIGVVSHMRDLSKKTKWTEDSEQPDIRRYGFRLDGEMAWERASLSQTRFVNNLRSELARDRDSTANDLKLSFFKSRFLELDRMRDFYDEQLKLVSF
jgi:S1-C subfamily serine protease